MGAEKEIIGIGFRMVIFAYICRPYPEPERETHFFSALIYGSIKGYRATE
jgi:hypothetical protein